MAKRVVLAMSGGVDSSAAAVLLHRQGYEVIGLFMRSGETEKQSCAVTDGSPLPVLDTPPHKRGCCSAEDAADARRVADQLGIPFHSLNFQDSFQRIKDYFVDEYLNGRTPNPCVQCNNWLKFGKLWTFAQQVGADHIATGHYARIQQSPGSSQWGLYAGVDPKKDQSYVLFGISPDLLPRILLPVGTYQKPEIRELASEAGLRVADKKDSYEICFVPNDDYVSFVRKHYGDRQTAGNFVDPQGNILGQHTGYEQFTVGQRKGLGIAFGEPRFVVGVNAKNQEVILGRRKDLDMISITVRDLNWLINKPADCIRCSVKVRYQQTARSCTLSLKEDSVIVNPDEPIAGVAPGQAAVFYDGDQVLGGGWID